MKKIVASVGLVAIGASGIQTASAQSLGAPDASKPWSVSATLRGFYDDNTATIPNNQTLPPGEHRGSSGIEVSASGALVYAVDQTTITLGALYSFQHYSNIPPNSTGHDDNTFTFNAGLTHAFNEQVSARVSDSFVVGQEPDFLRAGNVFSTFQRVSGDNIRNYGTIGVDAQLTPEFGISVGYDNAYYNYVDRGPGVSGVVIQPSLAGALNRIENRAHLELNYQAMPETKVLVGYQYTGINYTANELIGGTVVDPTTGLPVFGANGNPVVFNPQYSNNRNSNQHTMYVGAQQNFSPELTGSLRVGASYTEFPNDSSVGSTWTPYVNLNLRYNFEPSSWVEGGFSYDRNATDVVGAGLANTITLDAQSAVVYASLNYAIMPQLIASLLGQFQDSMYYGGTYNGDAEQYYLVGLHFEYHFNQYFSAGAGYNYDNLRSQLNRSYDRNRVYVGVTATY